MNYFLSEEEQMIVETSRELAQKKVKPIREKYDEEGIFPWDIVKEMADLGLCGLYIPQEYGGMAPENSKGIMNLVLCVEEMSKVCGGISLANAATALGTFPILLGATEAQKKKYLPDIASGKKLAAFGLTEANAGSDAGSMRTTAVKKGDKYVLNGTKQWITNGSEAEIYTVFAMTDRNKGTRGCSCFIVEKGTPGFTFGKKENKMGIRASATTELIFQDCEVPADNLVGGKEGLGFIHAVGTLNHSRPGVAAQALGIAAGALDEALLYSRQREQFGVKISSFQAVQHLLANMAVEVEAARGLVYNCARMVDAGATDFAKESAMAKYYASEVAMRVTTNAVQVFGGYGYMKEYPVEKMMRDAKITQIYEGTSQIQLNEIAAKLIKESAQKKK
ncbi:MAG TPA: acyl-CoA dehydrogenase family protein [Candidatus Goldiibacteriota bacterium]|nr:acyl-CoA dehydrogenase family protein [Candidatus Goldiibacteriota bacterium]